jgi:hypothetical protein
MHGDAMEFTVINKKDKTMGLRSDLESPSKI